MAATNEPRAIGAREDWGGHCRLNGPPFFEAKGQCGYPYAKFPRPLAHGLSSTFPCQAAIVSAVIPLLALSGPAAIFWLVVLIVVDSIYRSSFWRVAHVLKEIRELLPSFANLNSTTSVGRVIIIVAGLAPVPHRPPNGAGSCGRQPALRPTTAAARLSVSAFEGVSIDNRFLPAITEAPPSNSPVGFLSLARDKQLAKSPADESVFRLHMDAHDKITATHGHLSTYAF